MISFAANAAATAAAKIANAFEWPGQPPKLPLASPSDFVTLPDEDRATAIGNKHREIGKDRACGSGDILADRQTDRYRHTDTLTDVLITILRHHSRARSNQPQSEYMYSLTFRVRRYTDSQCIRL